MMLRATYDAELILKCKIISDTFRSHLASDLPLYILMIH